MTNTQLAKPSTSMVLDRFAIGGSLLCAIHCLLSPLLLLFIPLNNTAFHLDEHISHQLITSLVVPVSALALIIGYWRHQNTIVSSLGGLTLLLLVIFIYFGHDHLSTLGETICSLVLSALLVGIHLRNHSLCKNKSPQPQK